jgi:hypothetical protein
METLLSIVFFVGFPFLFYGMWSGILRLLSTWGGWSRLSETFTARDRPWGTRFLIQSGKVGSVNYKSCLTIHCTPKGFYMSIHWPFRLAHPTLFIPWEAVRNATTKRIFWFERVVFDVGSPSIATLQLSKRIFESYHVG